MWKVTKSLEVSLHETVLLVEFTKAVLVFVEAQVNGALCTFNYSLALAMWEFAALSLTFNHWPVTHTI